MSGSRRTSGRDVLIVGAGLAGSLLGVYLARAGWRVHIVERRADPRVQGYGGGRSINLALSVRGLWGLAGVGLDEVVMQRDAIPMRGRMLHPRDPARPVVFQPYSSNPTDAINSVSRGGLNLTLLNAAASEPNVELLFGQRCLDIDIDAGVATFQDESIASKRGLSSLIDGPTTTMHADVIIGADGAFSAVRQRLQKTDRFEYSQTYLGHGYKELEIPATTANLQISRSANQDSHHGAVTGDLKRELFQLEPHAFHIWPRGGSMMIALPNRDGSFTCTLFWPFDHGSAGSGAGSGAGATDSAAGHTFADLRSPDDVRAFFEREYPDAAAIMPTLVDDYLRNPVSSLVTVRCWPWSQVSSSGVATVILGDAAHAIVPFYGQGMNCAFEDVRVLAELLGKPTSLGASASRCELRGVLDEFQRQRKPNADAIADMALENFVEMRDKTARPEFLYKKKVEQAVHEMFAERVTPQYNLVSFSTVPYADARAKGRAFDAVLEQIIAQVPMEAMTSMTSDAWREAVRSAASTQLTLGEAVQ